MIRTLAQQEGTTMEHAQGPTLEEQVAALTFDDRYGWGQRSLVHSEEFGEVAESIIRALASATQADILQTKLAAVSLVTKIDQHNDKQERDRIARAEAAEEQGRRSELVRKGEPRLKTALGALAGKMKPVAVSRYYYGGGDTEYLSLDTGTYAASESHGEYRCGTNGRCSRQVKYVKLVRYTLKKAVHIEPQGACGQHARDFITSATISQLVSEGTLPPGTTVRGSSRYHDTGPLPSDVFEALTGLFDRTGTVL